jgi:hypothetical protein
MLEAFTAKAKQSAESKGGLKSFEITSEEISADGLRKVISTKQKNRNGEEKTEKKKKKKKDDETWKLSIGK